MSFELSNNNLVIKNSSNDVIFNTDTPMPHIISWGTVGLSDSTLYGHEFNITGSDIYFIGIPSGTNSTINCGPITINGVYHPFYYESVEGTSWSRAALPVETTTSKFIAAIDQAGVDADFILVNGGLRRMSDYNGQLVQYGIPDQPYQSDYGVINTTLPPQVVTVANNTVSTTYTGTVNLSGTTLLETAFTANGEQWFTRTLTLRYQAATSTTGGSIYADWTHSSNGWESDQQQVSFGTCGNKTNTSSTPAGGVFVTSAESFFSKWGAYFTVYFGRFTI